MRSRVLRTGILAMLAALAGCGGGRFRIVAPTLAEPVSATGVLFGADGRTWRVPDELEVVGRVEHTVRHWTILWSLVPLSPSDHDVSAPLGAAVAARGGDGVVNVEVTLDVNLAADMLGWIPLVPTVSTARVVGEIVRIRAPDR